MINFINHRHWRCNRNNAADSAGNGRTKLLWNPLPGCRKIRKEGVKNGDKKRRKYRRARRYRI